MHHFVPQGYLARFGEDSVVTVKRRDPAKVHDANVRNIAGEVGLYTIETGAGGTSTVVEEALADLDGNALIAMRWIDEHGKPPEEGSAERNLLSTYLAVQTTRTPRSRTAMMFPRQVTEYAKGRELTEELVSEYLQNRHLGSKPTPNEARAAWTYLHGTLAMGDLPTKTDATQVSMTILDNLIDPFNARHWRLEICRKPHFVTSDAPLVLWRRPSAADARKGVGILDAGRFASRSTRTSNLSSHRVEEPATADISLGRMCGVQQRSGGKLLTDRRRPSCPELLDDET